MIKLRNKNERKKITNYNKIIIYLILILISVSCTNSQEGKAEDLKVVNKIENIGSIEGTKSTENLKDIKDVENIESINKQKLTEKTLEEKDFVKIDEGVIVDNLRNVSEDDLKEKQEETITKKTEKPLVAKNEEMEKAIREFRNLPTMESAGFGIKVVNLDKGDTLYEKNSNTSFVPASNMKLLTTGIALEVLGKNFKFKTMIAHDGTITPNGELNGNLYIVGGGDPTLGSKYLVAKDPERVTKEEQLKQIEFIETWVEEIRKAGIKEINGDIIADTSYFPETTLPATWEWGDLRYSFASPPNSLSFLDNNIRLVLRKKTEERVSVEVYPEYTNTKITNKVLSGREGGNSRITLVVVPYSNEIIVLGELSKPIAYYTTVMKDPALSLATLLSERLNNEGIKNNKGRVATKEEEKNWNKVIYTYYSPSLEKIINYTNKYSVNLFAEHIKLQVEKSSGEKMKKLWSERINTSGLYIYDGSGLSRYNGMTPNVLIEVLKEMKKSKNFKSYYNSLAEPTKNGTFKDFDRETVLVNNFRGKSGTLTGVKAYSGYLYNINGDLLGFSIILNHHGLSKNRAGKEIEKIMKNIYYLK